MIRYIVVDPGGTYEVKEVPDDDVGQALMDELAGELPTTFRFIVGGTEIEGFGYVDDNGLMKGLDVNAAATALYWGVEVGEVISVRARSDTTPIVGRAILFGPPTPDGYETSVGDELVELVGKLSA